MYVIISVTKKTGEKVCMWNACFCIWLYLDVIIYPVDNRSARVLLWSGAELATYHYLTQYWVTRDFWG